MKMPITSNIRQTMNKQISKGMLKDIQNIARKKRVNYGLIVMKLIDYLVGLF